MTSRRRAGIYAIVLACAATSFAALSAAVLFWGAADRADVRFVQWVHRSAPEVVVDVMQVLTYAGSVVVLGALVLVSILLLARARRSGAALLVGSAFIGSMLLFQTAKSAFRRTRPELEDPFVQLTTYAFPSGHAFAATATYGALALVLASAASGTRRRRAILALGAGAIALVASSRVILGAHYVLDVVAGVAGGTALLAFLLLVLERGRPPFVRVVLFPRHEQPQRARLDP